MSALDSITDEINDLLGDESEEEEVSGTVDIDSLGGEELQNVITHLEAIGEETTRQNIEEAAYHLRNVEDNSELLSALENTTERGKVDRQLVAPNNMEREPDWHTRDGEYYRIFTATSLPRLVNPGWLVQVTLSDHDVRISMQVKPRQTKSVKGRLQKRLTQMKSAIQWKERRGRTDVYEEEHEQHELERLLRSVIEGTTKIFNVGLYFEVRGSTFEELEEASRNVKRDLSEQGIELTPVLSRQVEAQQSMVPVGTDPIKNDNAVQLEALSTFFNFVEPPVKQDGGILMGFDTTKRPVIVDRFSLSGHSKVVTGKVGGGKTFSVKQGMYRRKLNDDIRTIIFDPLGDDFVDFTEKMGGTVIKFGGEDRINPLEIQPPRSDDNTEDLYQTKVRSVLEILKTYFNQGNRKGMGAEEEGVLTQCINYAYAKMGITSDPSTFDNENPILDDVIEGVRIVAEGGLSSESSPVDEAMADGAGTLAASPARTAELIQDPPERHQEIAQSLVPKFESFKQGSVNNNLNGRTNIELDADTICFNMESFADTGEMPLIMHTMLDWAYQETQRTPKRTDVVFEEAHYLLDRPGARKLLNLFIRHARHFNAGLTLISQTPDEFLENDQKKEIYDQCDIKQLFYQENVSDEVIDYFDFSQDEVRYLRRAARGENSGFSECLLSTSEHGRRRMEIHAGQFEQHILDEDLDPWGYMEQQGFSPQAAQTGKSGILGEDTEEEPLTPDEMEQELRETTGSVSANERIDDLNELNETEPDDGSGKQPEAAPEVEDPYEVRSGGHPDNSSRDTQPDEEESGSEDDVNERTDITEQEGARAEDAGIEESAESGPEATEETDGVPTEVPSASESENTPKTNAELVKEKIEAWAPLFEEDDGETDNGREETEATVSEPASGIEEEEQTESEDQDESEGRSIPIPSIENETVKWALKTIPPILIVLAVGYYTLIL